MIPILILAAGSSSRMKGVDKLLEPVNGIPLLRQVAQRALDTDHPVFVALPSLDHARARVVADLDVKCLAVPQSREGLSGTMRGALTQLPADRDVMILLADMVAIDTADICTVLKSRNDQPNHLIWRGTTATGQPGHPIIFAAALRPMFAELHGDEGGAAIVKAYGAQTCLVPLPDRHARLDLDTPEDWENWRKRSD